MARTATVSYEEEREFRETLQSKIREFNNQNSAYHREVRTTGARMWVNLVLRDDDGQAAGGLAASMYWGWLEIEDLFLPDGMRRQGVGSELLRTAEEIAMRHGCVRAMLTTYSFQARVFYEKHGYVVCGVMEDYPPGAAYYWMRKELAAGRA